MQDHQLAELLRNPLGLKDPSEVGGPDGHARFSCSTIVGSSDGNPDQSNMGRGCFRHLVAHHDGTETLVDDRLASLAYGRTGTVATSRLREFAQQQTKIISHEVAINPNGGMVRIRMGRGKMVTDVKNRTLSLLQEHFAALNVNIISTTEPAEMIRLTAMAKHVERITGEIRFPEACKNGREPTKWIFCDKALYPISMHRQCVLNGVDIRQQIEDLKEQVKDIAGHRAHSGTGGNQERSSAAGSRGPSGTDNRKRSRSRPAANSVEEEHEQWSSKRKRQFVADVSRGSMTIRDSDAPVETLKRLLNEQPELTLVEKSICYSLFASLADEQKARLSLEESIRKFIGTVITPSNNEEEFDGSIPTGGDTRRPFLHLHREMSNQESPLVNSVEPRDPDQIPRGFVIIKSTRALVDAMGLVVQTYSHDWGPSEKTECPPHGGDRPYKLLPDRRYGDPTNRV